MTKLLNSTKQPSQLVSAGSITSRGRITIPKEIREKLALKEGDRLVFVIDSGYAIIRKAQKGNLSKILRSQKPWKAHSTRFQDKMRKEWR